MADIVRNPLTGKIAEVVKRSPFRLGSKPIYLPNFAITLLRTPRLSPFFAQFIVPRKMNKLDLRDYLFNAYSVVSLNITSQTLPHPVSSQGNPNNPAPQRGTLYRPAPTKKMTVRLSEPFYWPEEPTEEKLEEDWNKKTFQSAEDANEAFGQRKRREAQKIFVDKDNIKEMRIQAKRLLEGKERWEPGRKFTGSWSFREGDKSRMNAAVVQGE